ncbi:MAG: carboxylating nicotinate-nucleotide diphosphorylase [Planctomycetes bacterium]|nr:carboxylating nicotinate-nucleotide diphosphorylase [Planctomycetota bacterium]
MIDRLLELALDEDVGSGDVTTNSLVPEDEIAYGHFVTRQAGVLAGMEVVERLFSKLDDRVRITRIAREGDRVAAGQKLARIEGPARAVLTGERVALNLLQHMCGVASLTRTYVDTIEGTGAKVYDTRKTMPGMRAIDKLAVYLGGGENHRHGLFDMILIKDNHIKLSGPNCPQGSVACAVGMARDKSRLPVMLEVDNLEQLKEAFEMEPDMVLLDNMDADTLVEAVRLANTIPAQHGLRRPILEASGGVNLKTIRAIAQSGVDRISVGAITHSATALDIGLDFD